MKHNVPGYTYLRESDDPSFVGQKIFILLQKNLTTSGLKNVVKLKKWKQKTIRKFKILKYSTDLSFRQFFTFAAEAILNFFGKKYPEIKN